MSDSVRVKGKVFQSKVFQGPVLQSSVAVQRRMTAQYDFPAEYPLTTAAQLTSLLPAMAIGVEIVGLLILALSAGVLFLFLMNRKTKDELRRLEQNFADLAVDMASFGHRTSSSIERLVAHAAKLPLPASIELHVEFEEPARPACPSAASGSGNGRRRAVVHVRGDIWRSHIDFLVQASSGRPRSRGRVYLWKSSLIPHVLWTSDPAAQDPSCVADPSGFSIFWLKDHIVLNVRPPVDPATCPDPNGAGGLERTLLAFPCSADPDLVDRTLRPLRVPDDPEADNPAPYRSTPYESYYFDRDPEHGFSWTFTMRNPQAYQDCRYEWSDE